MTFKENMKNLNYDKLFHLKMNIRTKNGTYFSLEKNEVVRIKSNPKNDPSSESLNVPNIPAHLTTSKMIENAQQKVGADNLFIYSAQHRNCQHFITDLLKASGMNNPVVINFVKQDIEGLFKDTGFLRKISNIVTDLAGRFDVIKEGSGRKVQTIEELKQLPMVNRRQLSILNGQPNAIITADMTMFENPYYTGDTPKTPFSENIQGSGIKRSNKWIDFVKAYSAKTNISYKDALRSSKVKELYNKSK
jgi:hypothetical protein